MSYVTDLVATLASAVEAGVAGAPGRFGLWLPVLAGFVVSTVMSMGGISGAFLLLPFQGSVLGQWGPVATATNHLYNVVAIPSGVYRFVRERRMLWRLSWVIIAGTIPGSFLGSVVRAYWLARARPFKLFAGGVLLLIGLSLWRRLLKRPSGAPAPSSAGLDVSESHFERGKLSYVHRGREYQMSVVVVSLMALVVGTIGGAYGVGGGSMMSPLLIALYGLPVHTIAGATLLATACTSLVSVASFTVMGALGVAQVMPAWSLGIGFGVGGMLGTYCGARLQKYMPARPIEALLAVVVVGVGAAYVVGSFAGRV